MDLQNQTLLPIAELNPSLDVSKIKIAGTVTLIWPYSQSKGLARILLVARDQRLRDKKGQVLIEFRGSSAKAVARSGLTSGDVVTLSLLGVEWSKNNTINQTPGRSVDWELVFGERLILLIERNGQDARFLDVNHPTPSPVPDRTSPASPYPNGPTPQQTPATQAVNSTPTGSWSSPAFLKRKRLPSTSIFDTVYDPFVEEDRYAKGKGRKKSRYSGGIISWRYSEKTPTPEDSPVPSDLEYLDVESSEQAASDEIGASTEQAPSGFLPHEHVETEKNRPTTTQEHTPTITQEIASVITQENVLATIQSIIGEQSETDIVPSGQLATESNTGATAVIQSDEVEYPDISRLNALTNKLRTLVDDEQPVAGVPESLTSGADKVTPEKTKDLEFSSYDELDRGEEEGLELAQADSVAESEESEATSPARVVNLSTVLTISDDEVSSGASDQEHEAVGVQIQNGSKMSYESGSLAGEEEEVTEDAEEGEVANVEEADVEEEYGEEEGWEEDEEEDYMEYEMQEPEVEPEVIEIESDSDEGQQAEGGDVDAAHYPELPVVTEKRPTQQLSPAPSAADKEVDAEAENEPDGGIKLESKIEANTEAIAEKSLEAKDVEHEGVKLVSQKLPPQEQAIEELEEKQESEQVAPIGVFETTAISNDPNETIGDKTVPGSATLGEQITPSRKDYSIQPSSINGALRKSFGWAKTNTYDETPQVNELTSHTIPGESATLVNMDSDQDADDEDEGEEDGEEDGDDRGGFKGDDEEEQYEEEEEYYEEDEEEIYDEDPNLEDYEDEVYDSDEYTEDEPPPQTTASDPIIILDTDDEAPASKLLISAPSQEFHAEEDSHQEDSPVFDAVVEMVDRLAAERDPKVEEEGFEEQTEEEIEEEYDRGDEEEEDEDDEDEIMEDAAPEDSQSVLEAVTEKPKEIAAAKGLEVEEDDSMEAADEQVSEREDASNTSTTGQVEILDEYDGEEEVTIRLPEGGSSEKDDDESSDDNNEQVATAEPQISRTIKEVVLDSVYPSDRRASLPIVTVEIPVPKATSPELQPTKTYTQGESNLEESEDEVSQELESGESDGDQEYDADPLPPDTPPRSTIYEVQESEHELPARTSLKSRVDIENDTIELLADDNIVEIEDVIEESTIVTESTELVPESLIDPRLRTGFPTPADTQQREEFGLIRGSREDRLKETISELSTPQQSQSAMDEDTIVVAIPKRPPIVERLERLRASSSRKDSERRSSQMTSSAIPSRVSSSQHGLGQIDGTGSVNGHESIRSSPMPNLLEQDTIIVDSPRVSVRIPAFKRLKLEPSPTPSTPAPPPSSQPGFRTTLSYFTSLSSISEHFASKIDLIAMIISTTPIAQATKTPNDFYMTLDLVDRSTGPPTASTPHLTSAQIFRPFKDALPVCHSGDAILLRNFKVQSQGRGFVLQSSTNSSWAVFDQGETVKGRRPPVEFGPEERNFARELAEWWRAIDKETKAKIESLAAKRKETGKKEEPPPPPPSFSFSSSQQQKSSVKQPPTPTFAKILAKQKDNTDATTNGGRKTRSHSTKEKEKARAATPSASTAASQSHRGRRTSVYVAGKHELRDGTTYTDEPEEVRTRVHELRDGKSYIFPEDGD